MIKIEWSGLTEFLQQFHGIPSDIEQTARTIITTETEGAAQEIRQELEHVYQSRTGNLVNGVRTFYPKGTLYMGIVRNVSPHSHLMEWGTKDRFYGRARRGKIQQPEPKITPVIARRRRARMSRQLVDMLREMGFEVSGYEESSA